MATPRSKSRTPKKAAPEEVSKYRLYEAAVQSPKWQVDYLPQFHQWLTHKKAYSMREDFCGTARISCEWVRKSPRHRAVGLDLDTEPLVYCVENHLKKLSPNERSRLTLIQQDVRKPTQERFDLIGAYNFSFFIFLERKDLIKYFKAALKSLNSSGTFFLELAGGVGFKETIREPRTVSVPGYGKIRYVWEQHEHDPIKNISDYGIHFRLKNGSKPGKWLNDAFTYHWRLWGIREVREALMEAGFDDTIVLWETCDKNGDGTGEYSVLEEAEHAYSWIAYVVGVKGKSYSRLKTAITV